MKIKKKLKRKKHCGENCVMQLKRVERNDISVDIERIEKHRKIIESCLWFRKRLEFSHWRNR
jgi:hypothetical protein